MLKGSRKYLAVLIFTVGCVGFASVLRWFMGQTLQYEPFVVFLVAVVASSWYGGLWAGLLATALGTYVGYELFTGPPNVVTTLIDETNAGLFVAAGVLISALMALRARAVRQAQHTVVVLRRLAHELTQTEARQQREMAQRLHDELQQLLVASKMQVARLAKAPSTGQIESVRMTLDDLLSQAIAFTRTLTSALSPPVLYQLGLPAALQWLADQMASQYQLRVELDAPPYADVPDDELRLFVFRAVRELLINVAKHAHAEHARVVLRREGPDLRVTVEDHGVGYDVAATEKAAMPPGFGLFSIRQRLEVLGGHIHAESHPGQGTRTTFVLPCPVAQPAATSSGRTTPGDGSCAQPVVNLS